MQIIETKKNWIRQKAGESNYEAAVICPELFRTALIFEDEDRVKEHLYLIVMIFCSALGNGILTTLQKH